MEKVISKQRHTGAKGLDHVISQGRLFQKNERACAKVPRQSRPGVSEEQ